MFSTAHRSKGLEFETVIVADDFTTDFTMEAFSLNYDDGFVQMQEGK